MAPTLKSLGIDKLSLDDRVELAHAILDSVKEEVEAAPLTEAQKREIDRRLEAHRKNPEAAIPWEQIRLAALSRFVIADLSEPRSVQQELEAIAPDFQSVPIVPLINSTGKEYATFESIKRRAQVVKPTIRYRDLDDLRHKLDREVVPRAEAKLTEVRPPAPSNA